MLSAAGHASIELCDRNKLGHENNCEVFSDKRPEEDTKLLPSEPLPVDVNEDLDIQLTKDQKVGKV